jgi:hypothetical protein
MALRTKRRGTTSRRPTLTRLGGVRRTQLITTYGVGALIAFEDQSFVVGGLDGWAVDETTELDEFRLRTRLKVNTFHLPPAADEKAGDGVRARRFPERYTCPGDGPRGCTENLRWYRQFNSPRGRSECAGCGEPLTPSRFVVACHNGHLDDFPYFEWAHADHKGSGAAAHPLSFRTTGRSASLRSITIECDCGARGSMEGAFGARALAAIGYSCRGGRPWLGPDAREQGCSAEVRTLQRGSSAAWFPVLRSALSIPPFSRRLHAAVARLYPTWKTASEEDIRRLVPLIPGLLGDGDTVEEVLAAIRDYRRYEDGEGSNPAEEPTGFEASDVLRAEEYRQLSRKYEGDEKFECEPAPDEPNVQAFAGLDEPMLVHRLREVRALETFTRVAAPTEGDEKERSADLSLGDVGWLPAVEVIGEGVFLRLDVDRLREWERSGGATVRAERIREAHDRALARRTPQGKRTPASAVTPRLLLVHTLAHALMDEWSLDAGYPASALRERLYVSDEMAGVLIYTAASDSAGSLGGLVERGRRSRLYASMQAALRRASWCSGDPLCMESEASGVDSLNLAACHSCLLLPETSCEHNNAFLDRAALVGTPDDPGLGFFAPS